MSEKEFQRQLRLQRVNALINAISSYGRRFFRQSIDGRVSKFEIAENGRLYFRDKYSDRLLPCSRMEGRTWQRYFTEGGSLKCLVEALSTYIKTGAPINPYFFGPWSPNICKGDLWGYGESMTIIRDHACRLGITKGAE